MTIFLAKKFASVVKWHYLCQRTNEQTTFKSKEKAAD